MHPRGDLQQRLLFPDPQGHDQQRTRGRLERRSEPRPSTAPGILGADGDLGNAESLPEMMSTGEFSLDLLGHVFQSIKFNLSHIAA